MIHHAPPRDAGGVNGSVNESTTKFAIEKETKTAAERRLLRRTRRTESRRRLQRVRVDGQTGAHEIRDFEQILTTNMDSGWAGGWVHLWELRAKRTQNGRSIPRGMMAEDCSLDLLS